MFSNFIKNSEMYINKQYDINAPIIDTNNLSVNIETFILLLEVIEYWKPFEPYPNEINIFYIELFASHRPESKDRRKYISSYLKFRYAHNKTEEYYNKLLSHSNNIIIGKFVNNIELVNYVLDNNILSINNLLVGVSANGALDIVKYLISNSANPKAYYSLSLQYAASHGQLEIVKYLIDKGADPTVNINYPLQQSAYNGHIEVVKYLLSLSSTTNDRIFSQEDLKDITYRCHTKVAEYLKSVIK